jgi:hypothetical protein
VKLELTAIASADVNKSERTITALVLDVAGQHHELFLTEGMACGMLLGLIDQLSILQQGERAAASTAKILSQTMRYSVSGDAGES